MGVLRICKERFGRFSENPNKFRDEFIMLGLRFFLTWQDIMIILAHCCTPDNRNVYQGRPENMQMAYGPPICTTRFIRQVVVQSQIMTHTETMKTVWTRLK